MKNQEVNNTKANEFGNFVVGLLEGSTSSNQTFDSAAAADTATGFVSGRVLASAPEEAKHLFEENEAHASKIMRAVFDGVAAYKHDHGHAPSADILHQAIHSAYATTQHAKNRFALDSATTSHHDQQSIQAARAIVAIVSTLSEAIPSYAYYLPADIGSNQARLAVVDNRAASNFGAYKFNGSLNGVNSGDAYITSSRVHTLTADVDNAVFNGKLTAIQGDAGNMEKCDQDGAAVKLLRGRSVVYLNGRQIGGEIDTKGTGDSTVSGSVTIGSKTHQLSGKINTDTGVCELTFNPALPANQSVLVEGFIDFERAPEMTPSILTAVETFDLYAKPWRVTTSQTIDSRTQMSNELGLDPYSQQVLAVNQQFANERHYDVLRKAARLAVQEQTTMDFRLDPADFMNNRVAVLRAISEASQKMAIETMGYGIGVVYVGTQIAALLRALPSDMFEPSGVPERAGIYRIGRLLGMYDVYFTPKVVASNRMLCIGKAQDVSRNPFVLGDAVPATVIPLAVGADLKTGAGFYARNFTAINPYEPATKACAWININFI